MAVSVHLRSLCYAALLGGLILPPSSHAATPKKEEATPSKKVSSSGGGTSGSSGPKKSQAKNTGKASTAEKGTSTATKEVAKKSSGGVPEEAATPAPRKKAAPVVEPPPAENGAPASASSNPPAKERAPAATLATSDLAEFASLSPRVQRLITNALELTKRNLTYTYGSADPERGGMDCSGTMYYVLRAEGLVDVPRDSAGQYVWVRKAGGFEAVVSKSAESFEFASLRPGDLLFWTGTYSVTREVPVTHVMLYLGREKKTGQRVMFGASDGRSYRGIQRWGVSVFDFKMPKADPSRGTSPDFIGYGPIPGLRNGDVAAAEPRPPEPAKSLPADEPAAASKVARSSAEPKEDKKGASPAPAKKSKTGTKSSGSNSSGSTRKKSKAQ